MKLRASWNHLEETKQWFTTLHGITTRDISIKKKSIFFLNCKTSAMHVGTKRMEYTCTITSDPCSIFAGSLRVLNWNLKKLTNNQIWTKIPKREIFIFTWIFKKYQAIYLNFSLFITITFFLHLHVRIGFSYAFSRSFRRFTEAKSIIKIL